MDLALVLLDLQVVDWLIYTVAEILQKREPPADDPVTTHPCCAVKLFTSIPFSCTDPPLIWFILAGLTDFCITLVVASKGGQQWDWGHSRPETCGRLATGT